MTSQCQKDFKCACGGARCEEFSKLPKKPKDLEIAWGKETDGKSGWPPDDWVGNTIYMNIYTEEYKNRNHYPFKNHGYYMKGVTRIQNMFELPMCKDFKRKVSYSDGTQGEIQCEFCLEVQKEIQKKIESQKPKYFAPPPSMILIPLPPANFPPKLRYLWKDVYDDPMPMTQAAIMHRQLQDLQ